MHGQFAIVAGGEDHNSGVVHTALVGKPWEKKKKVALSMGPACNA